MAGNVSGVEAVDYGDDRGLGVAEEHMRPPSTLGTQTCLPAKVRMKWPRSWEGYFGRVEKSSGSGSVAEDSIKSSAGDAGLDVTIDDVVGVSSEAIYRLSCNLHCASKLR